MPSNAVDTTFSPGFVSSTPSIAGTPPGGFPSGFTGGSVSVTPFKTFANLSNNATEYQFAPPAIDIPRVWTGVWITGPDGAIISPVKCEAVNTIFGIFYQYQGMISSGLGISKVDIHSVYRGTPGTGIAWQTPYLPYYGGDTTVTINLPKGAAPGAYRLYEGKPYGGFVFPTWQRLWVGYTTEIDADRFETSGPRSAAGGIIPADFTGRGAPVYRYVDFIITDAGGTLPPPGGPPPPPPPKKPEGAISFDVSGARRRVRAFSVADPKSPDPKKPLYNVWIGRATSAAGGVWEDAAAGFHGVGVCIRYEKASGTGRVWLAYADGGSVLARYSDDDGNNWSTPLTIASGEQPRIAPCRDGRKVFAWVSSGGAVQITVLSGTSQVSLPTTTVLPAGASLDVRENGETGGAWFLEALVQVGGDLKFYRSDSAGKNWTEVTT